MSDMLNYSTDVMITWNINVYNVLIESRLMRLLRGLPSARQRPLPHYGTKCAISGRFLIELL